MGSLEQTIVGLLALDDLDRQIEEIDDTRDELERRRVALDEHVVALDESRATYTSERDRVAAEVRDEIVRVVELLASGAELRLVDASGDTLAEWDAAPLAERLRTLLDERVEVPGAR